MSQPIRKKVPSEARSPRRTGRPPTVATERQLRALEKAAALGLTQAMCAVLIFGVSERTFLDLKKRDAEVSAALSRGLAKVAQRVGGYLLDLCKSADTDAVRLHSIMWFERSRLGKSDKHTIDTPAEIPRVTWSCGIDPVTGKPRRITF